MKFLLKIFIVLIVFSSAAEAAGLSEYRENIGHIKEDLSRLINPDAGPSEEEEERKFIDEIYEELPGLFPPKQVIEWPGGSVEVDNEWLINKFASYKDLEPDAPERRQILADLYERLDAIEQKIIELENAALSERAKDEEKQKLAEILRREEYARPQKDEQPDESLIAAAYRRFTEWLRGLFPESENRPPPAPNEFQAIPFFLQLLIFALVFAFAGFLVYKFAPYLITRFQTRDKRERRERVILGEKIAADETPDNLFSEAERLAGEGDLRGAIRKGYIALLCELADRKIIGLSKNKTNRDYLRDVSRRGDLYRNMNGLTNNYERHWYGSETAGEADWKEFKNGYQKAVGSGRRAESG